MFDYEYYFVMQLQQKLKTKIVGRIFVKVTINDELYVEIRKEDEDLVYKMVSDHFSDKLRNGWSTDYAAYEIIEKYKRFITKMIESRYFYND